MIILYLRLAWDAYRSLCSFMTGIIVDPKILRSTGPGDVEFESADSIFWCRTNASLVPIDSQTADNSWKRYIKGPKS